MKGPAPRVAQKRARLLGASSEYALLTVLAAASAAAFGVLGGAMRESIAMPEAELRQAAQPGPAQPLAVQAAAGAVRRLLAGATRVAADVEVRPSAFRRALGQVAGDLFVDVPVRRKSGVDIFVLSDAIPEGDAAARRFLGERAALRPAAAVAAADGSDVDAFATRYRRLTRRGNLGDVRGDGRVVTVGTVDLRTPDGLLLDGEVQTKGVRTGLSPRVGSAADAATDIHQHGEHPLLGSLVDSLFEEYLAANGVSRNRSLGAVDLKERFVHGTTEANEVWGHASTLVRAGDFLRMAHLEELTGNPEGLRAALGFARDQLRARGVTAALETPEQLFRALIENKARQMVDLHWSRAAHGATTLDNLGVVEMLDVGSMTLSDRTHRGYQYSTNSAGYGLEGHEVLGLGAWKADVNRAFVPTLARYMGVAYGVDAAEFRRLGTTIAADAYEAHMIRGTLEHLGLGAADRARLLEADGDAVSALRIAVRDLGRSQSKVPYAIDGETIRRAATYDVFGALSVLLEAHAAETRAPGAGVERLVSAMAPLEGRTAAEHVAEARALLEAVAPIYGRIVEGLPSEVAAEKLHGIFAEAKRINAPIDLGQRTAQIVVNQLLEQYRAGEISTARIEAELRAWVRKSTRRGPNTPSAVADSILAREPWRFDGAEAVLSTVEEGGVRMRELATGEGARMEVVADPGLLPAGAELRYRTTPEGPWRRATAGLDGKRFDVRLSQGDRIFEFVFVDPARAGGEISRGGMPFGRNVPVISNAPVVRAALSR